MVIKLPTSTSEGFLNHQQYKGLRTLNRVPEVPNKRCFEEICTCKLEAPKRRSTESPNLDIFGSILWILSKIYPLCLWIYIYNKKKEKRKLRRFPTYPMDKKTTGKNTVHTILYNMYDNERSEKVKIKTCSTVFWGLVLILQSLMHKAIEPLYCRTQPKYVFTSCCQVFAVWTGFVSYNVNLHSIQSANGSCHEYSLVSVFCWQLEPKRQHWVLLSRKKLHSMMLPQHCAASIWIIKEKANALGDYILANINLSKKDKQCVRDLLKSNYVGPAH